MSLGLLLFFGLQRIGFKFSFLRVSNILVEIRNIFSETDSAVEKLCDALPPEVVHHIGLKLLDFSRHLAWMRAR